MAAIAVLRCSDCPKTRTAAAGPARSGLDAGSCKAKAQRVDTPTPLAPYLHCPPLVGWYLIPLWYANAVRLLHPVAFVLGLDSRTPWDTPGASYFGGRAVPAPCEYSPYVFRRNENAGQTTAQTVLRGHPEKASCDALRVPGSEPQCPASSHSSEEYFLSLINMAPQKGK